MGKCNDKFLTNKMSENKETGEEKTDDYSGIDSYRRL